LGFGLWVLEFWAWGLRLGVWGVEFGVWGLGFGVWDLWFVVWVLGFVVWGLRFGVEGLGFQSLGCRILGFGFTKRRMPALRRCVQSFQAFGFWISGGSFRVASFGFGVWGLGFRGQYRASNSFTDAMRSTSSSFRTSGKSFRVATFGLQVTGLGNQTEKHSSGFRVSGFGL
jgi:hypothetical protein